MKKNSKSIKIKNFQKKISTFSVPSECTIQQLKESISWNEGHDDNIFSLKINQKMLLNNKQLSQYKISEDDFIQMIPLTKGGTSIKTFKFNDLSAPVIKKFSSQAPEWRVLGPGINFQGLCQNVQCAAYRKRVWTQKNYGYFNVARLINTSKCPICKTKLIDVDNIAIYNAKLIATGMRSQSEQEQKMKFSHESKEDFRTFLNFQDRKISWKYLQFKVKQIKKEGKDSNETDDETDDEGQQPKMPDI